MGLHLLFPIVIQDAQVLLLNLTTTSYPFKLDTLAVFKSCQKELSVCEGGLMFFAVR